MPRTEAHRIAGGNHHAAESIKKQLKADKKRRRHEEKNAVTTTYTEPDHLPSADEIVNSLFSPDQLKKAPTQRGDIFRRSDNTPS